VPFLLPNVPARLRAAKPELQADRTSDLASCLRRRRKELGLFQPEAGKLIGVCKSSIWSWENNRAEPEDWLHPSIIRFLGREPWPQPKTLAERLRAARRRRGMSIQAAARLMRVAHGALANWENGDAMPSHRNRARVDNFLTYDPFKASRLISNPNVSFVLPPPVDGTQ
jgi:transcriptional regulator with XRE-family HTH domain